MRSPEGKSLIDYGQEPGDGLLVRLAMRIIAGFQGREAVAVLRRRRLDAEAANESAKVVARELVTVHVKRSDLGEPTGLAVSVREQPRALRINFELPTRLEWCDGVLTHWFGSQVRGQWPTLPGGISPGFAPEAVAKSMSRPDGYLEDPVAAVEIATLTVYGVLVKTLVLNQLSQVIGTLPALQPEQFEQIARAAGIDYAHYRVLSDSGPRGSDDLIQILFPMAPGVRTYLSANDRVRIPQAQRGSRSTKLRPR